MTIISSTKSSFWQVLVKAWISVQLYYKRIGTKGSDEKLGITWGLCAYNKLEINTWNPNNLHYGQPMKILFLLHKHNCHNQLATIKVEPAHTHVWNSISSSWIHLNQIEGGTSIQSTFNSSYEDKKDIPDVWCAKGKHIILRPPISPKLNNNSTILQELGLNTTQQRETWDLLWGHGKSKKISKFLCQVLTTNLTNLGLGSNSPKCQRCTKNVVETIRHCLFDCPMAHDVWSQICRLRKHLGITNPLNWRQVLLGCPEVLTIAKSLREAASCKCPRKHHEIKQSLSNAASIYLWELARASTLWHIWNARCDFVFRGLQVPIEVIILRIWKELVLSARMVQEEIEEKQLMNQDEDVHCLDEMFFICYHYRDILFRRGPLGCLTWFTNPPKWLINC